MDERDERLSRMMDTKLVPIHDRLDQMDSRLDRMDSRIDALETETRRTRVLVGTKVMHEIKVIAEQHGEIIKRLDHLEARRETGQALRSHVRTLEAAVESHTRWIEGLEVKIG